MDELSWCVDKAWWLLFIPWLFGNLKVLVFLGMAQERLEDLCEGRNLFLQITGGLFPWALIIPCYVIHAFICVTALVSFFLGDAEANIRGIMSYGRWVSTVVFFEVAVGFPCINGIIQRENELLQKRLTANLERWKEFESRKRPDPTKPVLFQLLARISRPLAFVGAGSFAILTIVNLFVELPW